jgi:hypothetical protein
LTRAATAPAIFAAGALLFFRLYEAPADPPFRVCLFHWLTNRPCPLCGLTRALCALAKGRWDEAVALHPLSPLVFCLFAAVLLWPILGLRLPPVWQARALPALAAVFLLFGVVRIAATL